MLETYLWLALIIAAGKTRTDNNFVLGSNLVTVDWHDVAEELIKLQEPVESLICDVDNLAISEYVLKALKIHHRITQIHPFDDGNGRCSRALLNWMLKKKNLPPIYFKFAEKNAYYEALECAVHGSVEEDGEDKDAPDWG